MIVSPELLGFESAIPILFLILIAKLSNGTSLDKIEYHFFIFFLCMTSRKKLIRISCTVRFGSEFLCFSRSSGQDFPNDIHFDPIQNKQLNMFSSNSNYLWIWNLCNKFSAIFRMTNTLEIASDDATSSIICFYNCLPPRYKSCPKNIETNFIVSSVGDT